MINRISEFIESQGISLRAFEQTIGASNGLIRKAIAKNTDIQSKWIESIVENYPHISLEWLITGQGGMLKTEQNGNNSAYIAISAQLNEGIPLIPISAMAGVLSGETSVLEYECERYTIPMFKGAEFMINVKGSSMYPKYNSGDIVACKRVNMSNLFFQWNKVYVIDTDQGALIKRIKPGSSADTILIVSDNEKYDPFELSLSAIYSVALVIGVVRLE